MLIYLQINYGCFCSTRTALSLQSLKYLLVDKFCRPLLVCFKGPAPAPRRHWGTNSMQSTRQAPQLSQSFPGKTLFTCKTYMWPGCHMTCFMCILGSLDRSWQILSISRFISRISPILEDPTHWRKTQKAVNSAASWPWCWSQALIESSTLPNSILCLLDI